MVKRENRHYKGRKCEWCKQDPQKQARGICCNNTNIDDIFGWYCSKECFSSAHKDCPDIYKKTYGYQFKNIDDGQIHVWQDADIVIER